MLTPYFHSHSDHDRRSYFWFPAESPDDPRPTVKELLAQPEDAKLYIGRKDWVRIRVEEEHWDDTSPTSGKAKAPVAASAPGAQGEQQAPVVEARTNGKPPYSLIVSSSLLETAFAH